MDFAMPDITPAWPEIFVLAMASIILVVDLFLSDRLRAWTYLLTLGTLVGAALLTVGLATGREVVSFSGMFVRDPMGDVLKLVSYLLMGLVLLYSREYLRDRDLFKGEFYVLSLTALLGVMVLISAGNFLTIYLGLELLSLSLYALVAFDRGSGRASEAAIKYFVLGSIASGALLYGMSILYGVTGTLDLAVLSTRIVGASPSDIGLLFGLAFVILGIAFKLGAVPFHMWIPDVYDGAPSAVTLLLGTVSKIASFALIVRLLVDGLGDMHASWQQILALLAALSMALGNVVAIAQTSIKRMLAYSTISHVGFILLGFLPGTGQGYAAAMFYTITYAITSAVAFGMVVLLSRSRFEADQLDDFKGLSHRSPWLAFVMLLSMFSLAGVPPLVGFHAKVVVIQATLSAGMAWLAVFAVVMAAIGLFYYLRVVWLMYFEEPEDRAGLHTPGDARIVIAGNGLSLVALGIYPAGLLALCAQVMG